MPDKADYRLIQLLSDGRFHSGEVLADALGVTRTAIWKRLKLIGYQFGLDIHAVRGRGYRLAAPLELLLAEKMFSSLVGNKHPAVSSLEIHPSLHSTSSYLLELSGDSVESGAVCLAEHQTAGRGRRGRRWVSPFGANLYFSIYWRFECGMSQLGGLSLAVGAVLADVLKQIGVQEPGLKWPNDIYVGGRKLAGILVDVQGPVDGPVDTIIGLGINVAMPPENDAEIGQPWTDLRTLGVDGEIRNQLAGMLVNQLLDAMQEYTTDGAEGLMQLWRKYDLYEGEVVTLSSGPNSIVGRHVGVDNDGSLLLEVDGIVKRFFSGEVSLRGGS